jgi:hypothetical protein
MRKATFSVIAGKPPADVAQPPDIKGMIVGVPTRRNSAERAKDSRRLVPESYEYQRSEGPFQDAEEPASTSDSEDWIHPGDERSVTALHGVARRDPDTSDNV